jgi:endonuclease/exonuclease/phosphatase (EEP) superfamily protein YafD
MIARIIPAVLLVVAGAILLVIAWPQLFFAEQLPLIAQVVSLRAVCVVVAVSLIVVMTLVALLARPLRRFAAFAALLLVLFSAVNVAVLAERGFGDIAFETASESGITVLSWNTLGDAPGADVIADLAVAEGADVVALPETTERMGAAVAARMERAGSPMTIITKAFDQISKARSTTLLVSAELGDYEEVTDRGSTHQLPSVVAVPVDGTGPTILAVHPVAPIPGELSVWSSDLDWLSTVCTGDNVIMAGDFNSTLDHYTHLDHAAGATIGDCSDAAALTGNAAVGTWPTALSPLLGTPIDHILVTDNWRVSGMRVVESEDGAGSDHRPIVAQLVPAS